MEAKLEPTSYDAVIADLEARRDHLNAMIESLKQLRLQVGDGTVPTAMAGGRQSVADSEICHDTFFGMTIADAAKKYLGMVKQTKSTADIAEALESGGLKHSSKDFQTTLRAILGPRDEFVRVNRDWGLTEWYPGMRKDKKAKPEKSKVEKKSQRGSKQKKLRLDASGPTLKEKILEVMKSNPTKKWTATAIAKDIQGKRPSVQSILTKLASDGSLIKGDVGYSIPKPQAA